MVLEGYKVLVFEAFSGLVPYRRKRDLQSTRKISSSKCGHRYFPVCCESISVSLSLLTVYTNSQLYVSVITHDKKEEQNERPISTLKKNSSRKQPQQVRNTSSNHHNEIPTLTTRNLLSNSPLQRYQHYMLELASLKLSPCQLSNDV